MEKSKTHPYLIMKQTEYFPCVRVSRKVVMGVQNNDTAMKRKFSSSRPALGKGAIRILCAMPTPKGRKASIMKLKRYG